MNSKQKTKKVNGVENGLSPDLQMVREQVLADELRARHWKAQYETVYYHLEFEKLLPAYKELIERQKAEKEEADKKHAEFMESLKKNIEGMQNVEAIEPKPEYETMKEFMSPENIE
jgi:hypothetical protein